MIEKSCSPVYSQVTECYYVTSQSVADLENLGPIGSTKHIVEQKGDLSVYEVTPEGQKGKSRILHRNLLLPCDFLQSDLPKRGPQLPERGKGQLVLTKEASFISMVVTVGMRGSYLASHPPSWKCCQRQQQKQTTIKTREYGWRPRRSVA